MHTYTYMHNMYATLDSILHEHYHDYAYRAQYMYQCAHAHVMSHAHAKCVCIYIMPAHRRCGTRCALSPGGTTRPTRLTAKGGVSY